MKKLFVLSLATVASVSAFGQVAFVGTTFAENFDGLAAATLISGNGTPSQLTGATGWYASQYAGTTTTNSAVANGSGTSNSGAIYRAGATTSATDKSLASVASSGRIFRFGVAIQNTLTGPTDVAADFQVKFDAMEFRKPNNTAPATTAVVNTLAFSWIKKTSFLEADLNATGYTPLTAGDIVSSAPVDSTVAALTTPIVTAKSFTITGVNLAPGEVLWLRWDDVNEFGNDAMLGINNFQAVPEPATMAALGLGLAGIAARRRRK